MICVDCKRNIAMVGETRCYDCELLRLQQVIADEMADRPAAKEAPRIDETKRQAP